MLGSWRERWAGLDFLTAPMRRTRINLMDDTLRPVALVTRKQYVRAASLGIASAVGERATFGISESVSDLRSSYVVWLGRQVIGVSGQHCWPHPICTKAVVPYGGC
jgi:hypothetical protein